ncbi:MAG: zinc finger CCHC domain-containing protein, partial [Pseudomonadota bacterium]
TSPPTIDQTCTVSGEGSRVLGRKLPRASELSFKQPVVQHQWRVNEGSIDLLNKALDVASQTCVDPAVRVRKMGGFVTQALGRIVDRQETLLIGKNMDWRVVAQMERQSQLDGISASKKRSLAAAPKACPPPKRSAPQAAPGASSQAGGFGNGGLSNSWDGSSGGWRGSGFPRAFQGQASARQDRVNAIRERVCYACGDTGHFIRDCRMRTTGGRFHGDQKSEGSAAGPSE